MSLDRNPVGAIVQCIGTSINDPFSQQDIDLRKLSFNPKTQKKDYLEYSRELYLRPIKRKFVNTVWRETIDSIYTIEELSNDKKYEKEFFSVRFRENREKEHLDLFNVKTVPKRMDEIVQIATGKAKNNQAIRINFTTDDYSEDRFLWYIIAFTKGKVSASFKRRPFDYITLPTEAKKRILETQIIITTFFDPAQPHPPKNNSLCTVE